MSTDDRTHTNDVPALDAAPLIQDLTAKDLGEPAAEEVKGGATTTTTFSNLSIMKVVDKTSPILY